LRYRSSENGKPQPRGGVTTPTGLTRTYMLTAYLRCPHSMSQSLIHTLTRPTRLVVHIYAPAALAPSLPPACARSSRARLPAPACSLPAVACSPPVNLTHQAHGVRVRLVNGENEITLPNHLSAHNPISTIHHTTRPAHSGTGPRHAECHRHTTPGQLHVHGEGLRACRKPFASYILKP
jgi:hypothetical protein